MNFNILAALPVFFLVLLGFFCRKTNFASKEFGKKLLDFTLVIPITATAFLALSKLRVSPNDVFLPLSAALFVFAMLFLGNAFKKRLGLKKIQEGVFRTSLMIPNTGFLLMFAIPIFGTEGAQSIFLFELASIPLIFSLVYYIAAKNSPTEAKTDVFSLLKKITFFPPFLASVAGLAVVLLHATVPPLVVSLLSPLDAMSFPLLAFSTGIFLESKLSDKKLLFISVVSKMGLGFLLGLFFVWIFGLQGFAKIIVLAACSSPIGFNTVAFASRENLDVELAASMLFVSLLIGLVSVPAIFLLA